MAILGVVWNLILEAAHLWHAVKSISCPPSRLSSLLATMKWSIPFCHIYFAMISNHTKAPNKWSQRTPLRWWTEISCLCLLYRGFCHSAATTHIGVLRDRSFSRKVNAQVENAANFTHWKNIWEGPSQHCLFYGI